MADIELVIKIHEDIMEYIKNNGCLSVIYNNGVAKAVTNGTPLPKEHGDLIDRNECLKMKMTDLYDKDGVTMYAVPTGNILRMKPIVEADKENAEEVMVENLEKTKGRNASDPIAINCFECAEEHRQLAEWLKELKQLREPTSVVEELEKIKAEVDKKYDELYVIDEFTNGEASAYVKILEIVNEHISEMKGENNEGNH